MVIGLCGSGFPEVRRALQGALPDVEIVDVPVSAAEEAAVPAVDVLVPLVADVDGALLDAARPRLVQQFGVGLQGVDLRAARERGIPVANVPAADTGNATAVAEITLLHILALLRRYHQAQRSIADRRVGQPCGSTLAGKTVAVVGVGAIGAAVIARLDAFGAIALGVGRREYQADPTLAELLPPQRYYRIGELDLALARADVVVLCVPLTEHTRGLIGREQLAALPRGGYLVNVGRGPVVDYTALLHALREGHLAGAGIDVAWEEPIDPSDELLRENVTITPHIGGVTVESYAAMAATFAANVRSLRSGARLQHRAD